MQQKITEKRDKQTNCDVVVCWSCCCRKKESRSAGRKSEREENVEFAGSTTADKADGRGAASWRQRSSRVDHLIVVVIAAVVVSVTVGRGQVVELNLERRYLLGILAAKSVVSNTARLSTPLAVHPVVHAQRVGAKAVRAQRERLHLILLVGNDRVVDGYSLIDV